MYMYIYTINTVASLPLSHTCIYMSVCVNVYFSSQNLLFNPQQGLFLHQSSSVLALIPTFTDLSMMVTCLVAQFRCNYRNTHIFSVCLNPSSPPVFKLAFIKSIHTLLKQVQVQYMYIL